MKFLKKLLSFEYITLTIITVLAVAGLFNSQYFSIHDDQHIARLYLLDQAIKQGSIYPRFVGGLGFNFGYPLFNFYPPLIYYVSEFFHLIGFNLLWSLKLMIVFGTLISSIGMYLLGKKLFNKRAGLLAATIFTFFFYRAITVYIRGAWAEFFAMSILPFVFLGLEMGSPVIFGISLGLLILAHPLIAFPTFLFLGIFIIYYLFVKRESWLFLKNYFIGIFLALGLSSFFWLPSLVEKKYTLVDSLLTHELASYKIHFVYPFQFWFSQWGYGGSIAGPVDGMSFQLGKIPIFLSIFSFIVFFIAVIRKKNDQLKTYIFVVFLLIFSLFMSSTYSEFVWDKIRYLWYLQFPWRFLTFTGIFISLVAGASIFYFEKIIQIKDSTKNIVVNLFLILILVITVVKYLPYFKPHDLKDYDEKKLTSFEEISWRVSKTSFEFSPIGIKTKKTELGTTTIGLDRKNLTNEVYEVLPFNKQNVIKTIVNKFSKKEFKIESKSPVEFRLNTFNFPGWHASLDGQEIKIKDNNNYKLITVLVSEGSHTVSFVFKDTLIRTFGNLISLTSLILASYFYFARKKHSN